MDAIFACPADKRRRQHELGNCALMVLAHKKLGLHHQDEGPFSLETHPWKQHEALASLPTTSFSSWLSSSCGSSWELSTSFKLGSRHPDRSSQREQDASL